MSNYRTDNKKVKIFAVYIYNQTNDIKFLFPYCVTDTCGHSVLTIKCYHIPSPVSPPSPHFVLIPSLSPLILTTISCYLPTNWGPAHKSWCGDDPWGVISFPASHRGTDTSRMFNPNWNICLVELPEGVTTAHYGIICQCILIHKNTCTDLKPVRVKINIYLLLSFKINHCKTNN